VQLIAQKLLKEQFAVDDAAVTPTIFRHLGAIDAKHLIEWSEGVSTGEVTIEQAANETYAGSWSPIAVVTFDGSVTPAPKVDVVDANSNGLAFRHRITGIVEGGTVTTKISGAE
jgi:hypothetical protein